MSVEDKVTSAEQKIVADIQAAKDEQQKAASWWDTNRTAIKYVAIALALGIIAGVIAAHLHGSP